VFMTHVRGDRQSDGLRIQFFRRRAAPNPAGVFSAGVGGDTCRIGLGAAGKNLQNSVSEIRNEMFVFGVSPLGGAFALSCATIFVGQTLRFGFLDCVWRNEYALAFVALSGARPPYDHRAQCRVFGRAPGQGRVAPGQEFEMSKIGAIQAERAVLVQTQKLSVKQRPAAFPAFRVASHNEHNDLIGFSLVGRGLLGIHERNFAGVVRL